MKLSILLSDEGQDNLGEFMTALPTLKNKKINTNKSKSGRCTLRHNILIFFTLTDPREPCLGTR